MKRMWSKDELSNKGIFTLETSERIITEKLITNYKYSSTSVVNEWRFYSDTDIMTSFSAEFTNNSNQKVLVFYTLQYNPQTSQWRYAPIVIENEGAEDIPYIEYDKDSKKVIITGEEFGYIDYIEFIDYNSIKLK